MRLLLPSLLFVSLLFSSLCLPACGDDDYGIDLARTDISAVADLRPADQ